jgi:threonine/homoserine/homoserine lactone efflux protein
MLASALIGFGLGFAVAATIGPISLLLIRTTLRGARPRAGWRSAPAPR